MDLTSQRTKEITEELRAIKEISNQKKIKLHSVTSQHFKFDSERDQFYVHLQQLLHEQTNLRNKLRNLRTGVHNPEADELSACLKDLEFVIDSNHQDIFTNTVHFIQKFDHISEFTEENIDSVQTEFRSKIKLFKKSIDDNKKTLQRYKRDLKKQNFDKETLDEMDAQIKHLKSRLKFCETDIYTTDTIVSKYNKLYKNFLYNKLSEKYFQQYVTDINNVSYNTLIYVEEIMKAIRRLDEIREKFEIDTRLTNIKKLGLFQRVDMKKTLLETRIPNDFPQQMSMYY